MKQEYNKGALLSEVRLVFLFSVLLREALSCVIVRMEKLVSQMRIGLAQELVIDRLDLRIVV